MKGTREALPTPYAEDIGSLPNEPKAFSKRIARIESQRKFWTWVSTIRYTPSIRFWFSIAAPASAGVILTNWEYSSVEIAIIFFSILSILLLPPHFSSLFAKMSARHRLQLRIEGFKSKEAYPGVERILNTLHERILRERVRLFSAILSALSLFAVWEIETGYVLGQILVSFSVILGFISWLNTFYLEGSIPMRSNKFPLLSLHAPTLHESVLNRVLTDVLVAHLDPETAGSWDDWTMLLEEKVRDGHSPSAALEHMLTALHLNDRGLLTSEEMMSSIREVYKISALDKLTDTTAKINIVSIQSLLAHTRAWQPGLFRLIDRLHDASKNGELTLSENKWRTDLDLPPRSSDGQSDLFVMVHNGGDSDMTIEVEIVTAHGEPEVQTLRVPCKRTRIKEVVTLDGLLDSALVLWIGLAWPSTVSGPHPVQVTINGDDGNTLSSTIVQTTLTSSLHPESAGVRMADAAEEVRRLALSVSE
ncbi:TPA: hypothetical protein HA324_04165 [Candidatus Thalassarchaeaceae archaeon]|nr:MAG TPA: hypothetical protein D7I14_04130 [Candidatus Poseidoniales archaeon]HII42346.1 hypothetical protein [Candidatus Thalassarchaeaceae archaeon]